MSNILQATQIVFSSRRFLVIGFISFIVLLAVYLFTLPATYTGGKVGIVSIKLITPQLIVFAILFSLLVSFLIPFTAYLLRNRTKRGLMPTAGLPAQAGGFLGSILPPLLCCSPILPALAATLGGGVPLAFSISGFVQGFIARFEIYIYLAITAILVYSLYQSAKIIIKVDEKNCLC